MFLLGILCSVLSLLQGGDATLVFAGDAMQHDRQIEAARRSDGSFDYSAYFRHVADYVSAADYAVVNLECTLGGKPYKGYPCFSAPYSQPATAKLLICRKKTSFGVSKFSFLRGLRLILC